MNRKRGVNNNNNNKLLYDPNQRQQKRLGAFSMDENNSTEEEQNTNTKTSTNTNENSNNELNNNQNELENKKEDTNNTTEQSDNESGEDENKTLLGGKRTVAGRVAAKVLMFLLANPVTWLFLGVFFLILIIVVILGGGADTSSSNGNLMGLYGYPYYELNNYCEKVTVYREVDGKIQETGELDFETEYIPGVVQAEVGNLTGAPELYEAAAIVARTYALARINRTGECRLQGSSRFQAFTYDEDVLAEVTQEDHPIMQAVMATYGLIAVRNGNILTTTYDAACYMGEQGSNYIVGYGNDFYDGYSPQLQYIPKSWADNTGFTGYIRDSKAESEEFCWNTNGHGGGMSQYGAYYLASEENYTAEAIINYYYNSPELYSIYETVSNNYTISTSSGLNDILTMSLRDFFASKGTSVEEFNDYILGEVLNAGIGTRDAAVISAVAMVGGLYQYYGVRLPYTYGGNHGNTPMYHNGVNINLSSTSFYGVDPNWGSVITSASGGEFVSSIGTTYPRYGPDCSGFITLILRNAGFNAGAASSGTQGNYGTKRRLTENGEPTGQPGDLMWHEGHIMMIVGVDREAQVYYIAHASGKKDGVKINSVPFSKSSEYVVDMTEWYANNALNVTEEEFIEIFRNGYVDGYTNEYNADIPVSSDILFVGDSRTVGMCLNNALCDDTSLCETRTCLARSGAGINWFSSQISEIESSYSTNIVINMGVNDIAGNTNATSVALDYYDLFEQLAEDNPNKNIYIMSVNPVDEGENVSNTNIREFNVAIQTYINNSRLNNLFYLDTNNDLIFTTTDGLHYDNATYRRIYRYVLGRVG